MADILIKDTLLVTVDELRPGYFIFFGQRR